MLKSEIIALIVEHLRGDFDARRASSIQTRTLGNDGESKAEDKYDTRSTEDNYLADGLSRQALAALQAAAAYEKLPKREFSIEDSIDLGALVELQTASERMIVFLGPAAGGIEIETPEISFTVITPDSPLGSQLMGKRIGAKTERPAARIERIA